MKSEQLQAFFRRINLEIQWFRSDLDRIGNVRGWFSVGRHGRKIKAANGSSIRWQEIPFPASKRIHAEGYSIASERLQNDWNTLRNIRADYNAKRCDGVSEFLRWLNVESESVLNQSRIENVSLPMVRFDQREQTVFRSLAAIGESVRQWYIADDGFWVDFRKCETKQEAKRICEQIERSEKRFPLDVETVDRLQTAVDNAGLMLAGENVFALDSTNAGNAERIETLELGESLDINSKEILQAMFELNCNELNRLKSAEIIKAALRSGDEKRAFDQLKRLDLVAAKEGRGGGYWLTQKGINIASKINGGTVTPTDCQV